MLFIHFICLFYLMVLSHCLTISKSNQRTPYDYETYERINNLDDSNYNYKQKYEKRDLFHDKYKKKAHRDQDALVLEKDTTKTATRKAFWGKIKRLFYKNAKTTKRKSKTTKTTNSFDYSTEDMIPAEMMMYYKTRKSDDNKNELRKEHGRNYKFDNAMEDFYGGRKYRKKRHPKKVVKALNHQYFEQPTISYVMRKITVQIPLDSNVKTTRKHHLKTRSIHPLRVVQNQVKKLNKPMLKIDTSKHKTTTTDVTDKMNLMNPYKYKIATKFDSTCDMENYLRNVKSKTAQEAIKLQQYNEIIAHSVTEAMFGSDPFTQLTSTPLSEAFTTKNIDETKKSEKYDEQHLLNFRSDSESTEISIGDKIYTVTNDCENKIQSKLNKMYEKLKRRFNYKSQVGKPSTKMLELKNTKNVTRAKTTNLVVLINNKNQKPKRCNKKTYEIPKHQQNLGHNIISTEVHAEEEEKLVEYKNALSDSDDNVKEKKSTDIEMLEVLQQMLKKMHKTNVNYLMSTAQDWTPKFKKKSQSKRSIFNTNALAKSFDTPADNKYENLAKKIAFDDYVNGFKHYLNFQKRLNKDNFSNTVKFQAHMHHDVNDIGKYILKKIPQTPKRLEKRDVFEDPDLLDDMEVSTKTDENWFKKHFNLFVETNAPKKKFHSMQTVSLKPPTEVPTMRSTKLTTVAPKSTSETTPTQIEKSTDDETYPVDATDILTTHKAEDPTLSGKSPEDVQITLTEKTVYLKNIGVRQHALKNLRERLKLSGLGKQIVEREEKSTANNAKMKSKKMHKKKRAAKLYEDEAKHKVCNVIEKPKVVTELSKLFYTVEKDKTNIYSKIKHKHKKPKPMKHKRQFEEPRDRLPRFNFFNKLKHIFVIDESTTLGYSNLANLASRLRQFENDNSSPESKDLNIQDILKSLQNISRNKELIDRVEKPYIFKDDENYDQWYDIDGNTDSSTKNNFNDNVLKTTHETTGKKTFKEYDFEALNNKNEALDKLEADLKKEVLKNLEDNMTNDALVRNEAISKIEAQLRTEAMNKENIYNDDVNNEDQNNEFEDEETVLKKTKAKTTSVPFQDDPLSLGKQTIYNEKFAKNELNEVLKAHEKDAKHKLKKTKSHKKHPPKNSYDKKHLTKKTTCKTKAHSISTKNKTNIGNQSKERMTSTDTYVKTLVGHINNDVLRGKSTKTDNSVVTTDKSKMQVKVIEEDETDDNLLKDNDTDDSSNHLQKEADAEYSNIKSLKTNTYDKEYTTGSFKTQWNTVTKAYDSKPITHNVDAVVKYVSVTNDNPKMGGKNINANKILKNALKAMLDTIDSEKKMKINTESPDYDTKYEIENNANNDKTSAFEIKDHDKSTSGNGDTNKFNCHKSPSENANENTEQETIKRNEAVEDSGNDYDYDYPSEEHATIQYTTKPKITNRHPLATNEKKAQYVRHCARNKKNDDIQAYPYNLYKYNDQQNYILDEINFKTNDKMSISVEFTTNRVIENRLKSSFEPPVYKKLRENEFNTNLKNNLENVSTKRHDYFNDLVSWNGDVLNRDTDFVGRFMKNLNTNQLNLDSLRKEVEDINVYLKRVTTTTEALPNEMYTITGTLQKYKTTKPIFETYHKVAEEMLERDDDRFYFDNAVKAQQSEKSEELLSHTTPFYMDTTLMAYDEGDISFAMNEELEKQQPRKKSRGSANSIKKYTEKKTTRPKQFFTTPLPMTSDDFERFLKEYAIDVKTVTAPIFKKPKMRNGDVEVKLNSEHSKDDELETEILDKDLRNAHQKMQEKLGKVSGEVDEEHTKVDEFEKELRVNGDGLRKGNWKKDQPVSTVYHHIGYPLEKSYNNVENQVEKGHQNPKVKQYETDKIDMKPHEKDKLFRKVDQNKINKVDMVLHGNKDKVSSKQLNTDKHAGLAQNLRDTKIEKWRKEIKNLQNNKENTKQDTGNAISYFEVNEILKNNKFQLTNEQVSKILHSYELETNKKQQHDNSNNEKKIYKPKEPAVKILFKPKRKIRYNFDVNGEGVNFKRNSAEISMNNDHMTQSGYNDKTEVIIHKLSDNREHHTKDPRKTIKLKRKSHRYKIRITTSPPKTNLEVYENEYNEYDEGEYEKSEWRILIDSDHKNETTRANLNFKKHHRPQLVKQEYENITNEILAKDTTDIQKNEDLNPLTEIVETNYFLQKTQPETAYSNKIQIVEDISNDNTSPNVINNNNNNPSTSTENHIQPASNTPQNDNVKRKRFRTSWLPFSKHSYSVRTFPSKKLSHPNVMVTQNDFQTYKKNALNNIKQMEDAIEFLGIFHHKETTTEHVYDIAKDIEALQNKPVQKPKEHVYDIAKDIKSLDKPACKPKENIDTDTWSEKINKLTKGMNVGKQQKENSVSEVTQKHISTDAVKQIKINGMIKIYNNYDVMFHKDQNFAKKPSDSSKWVEFTTRPQMAKLKEHIFSGTRRRDDSRGIPGRRMIKRSKRKELGSLTTVTNGRQERKLHKLKFLPVPEHNWRISHLWAKNNSTRKKSAKIKSLPGVKWKPSAAKADENVEYRHKDEKLNDYEGENDNYDYDQVDLQEGNNGEGKSRRSFFKIPLLTTTTRMKNHNYVMQRTLNRDVMLQREKSKRNNRKQRDVPTHSVKNVNSIEVIVEMKKNAEALTVSKTKQSQTEKEVKNDQISMLMLPTKPASVTQLAHTSQTFTSNNKENVTNNIIDTNNDVIEKHLTSARENNKLKKVFRAKFSYPVDLEYQIKAVDDSAIVSSTKSLFSTVTVQSTPTDNYHEGPTPGVYVLVDKDDDNTAKCKQYVLKPVIGIATQSPIVTRNERVAPNTTVAGIATTPKAIKNTGRVTLSRDVIVGIKELLAKLPIKDTPRILSVSSHQKRQANNILVSRNESKRDIILEDSFPEKEQNNSVVYKCIERKEKPSVWKEIKRKIGIKSRCPCLCKLNKPMCGMCSASDAVMTELIFEFDNIADFMNNHCREIQNYFMLNPKGGQKLRDRVKALDKQLKDYYNRAKGKCKNDCCCSKFISYWDKRSTLKRKRRHSLKENTLCFGKKLIDKSIKPDTQNNFISVNKVVINENNHKSTTNKKWSIIEEKLTAIINSKNGQRSKQKGKTNKAPFIVKGHQKQVSHISEENNELNEILSKDLRDLNKDLEDLMLLNLTLNKRISRKVNILKGSNKNKFHDDRPKRNVSNYRVENVKINIIGDSKEAVKNQSTDYGKRFIVKYNASTAPNILRKEKFYASYQKSDKINEPTTFPNSFTIHKMVTNIANKTTMPNGNDKYKEYSEIDEEKRKNLYKRLHNLFSNHFNEKCQKGLPSKYCIYKNKPYKIIGPIKRHVKDYNQVTDNLSVNKENEESFYGFPRKAKNEDGRDLIIDAALKEIIATDCVSRVKDTILRSTENPNEKDERQKNNDLMETHKSIEEILDILVLLEKVMKINNLTESFHDLLLNEYIFSKDDTAKPTTSLQASSSPSPMKNVHVVDIKPNKNFLPYIFPKLSTNSNIDNNIFSTLDPKKLFSESVQAKNTKTPEEFIITAKISTTGLMKPTNKAKYTKPTKADTVAVYNTNIHNFITTINLEHTKDPSTNNATIQKKIQTLRHGSTQNPSKFVTYVGSTVVNEDLKRILSSYGLKEVTSAIKQQKTTPKIAENRNILLTILMYEAINLSKEFQKFSTPDEYLPTRANSIESQISKKTNTQTTIQMASPMKMEINKNIANIKYFLTRLMKNKQTGVTKNNSQTQEAIDTLTTKKPRGMEPTKKIKITTMRSTEGSLKSEVTQSLKYKPITNIENVRTKLIEKSKNSRTRPTETIESLPDQTTETYTWNIHVCGKKLGSTTASDKRYSETYLKALTKQSYSAGPSENMLVKFVQKIMPKKFPWRDSKMDHTQKAPIAKWVKKHFSLHASTENTVKTSDDYLNTVPMTVSLKGTEGSTSRSKISEKCVRKPSECLCDLEATFRHILECHRTMPKDVFERFVKNITCKSYKEAPKNLILDVTKLTNNRKRFDRTPRGSKKWDWIRNKRAANAHLDKDWELEDTSLIDVKPVRRRRNLLAVDVEFERLFKDGDGIYRSRSKFRHRRSKRELDLTELNSNLMKLPTIDDTTSNQYAVKGDTLEIKCGVSTSKSKRRSRNLNAADCTWNAERSAMLFYDNVLVDRDRIVLKNVQPKNTGIYNCSIGDEIRRSVKLNVLTLPDFTILFLPAYDTGIECHYRDLQTLQYGLPIAMADFGCSGGKFCSVRVEDPMCLRDEDADRSAARGSAFLTAVIPEVLCSAQCRRDLQCAMTMLCARNVPLIASVPVVLLDDVNERRFSVASLSKRRWIVTHTLRRRATSGSTVNFRHILSKMAPGDINVVVSCPPGHYLLADKKVCAACPMDTFSEAGNNECRPCPPEHTTDEPGSADCRMVSLLRRYDKWCSSFRTWILVCMLPCLLCVCCCIRHAVDLSSRANQRHLFGTDLCWRHLQLAFTGQPHCRWLKDFPTSLPSTSTAATSSATDRQTNLACKNVVCQDTDSCQPVTRSPPRPISPSRVILAKFFRSTPPSSTWKQDSCEQKFDRWRRKRKKRPPPLPTIDFEF